MQETSKSLPFQIDIQASKQPKWPQGSHYIFTARKRSCGKVMFYTCLSVILFTGVCVSQHASGCLPLGPGRCTLPWVDTFRTHLPGQIPPWADTPLGRQSPRQTPPGQTSTWADTSWADIPLGRHPLQDTPPSGQTPPRQTPPDTHKLGSPQSDTSHPTGMHCCYHPHRSCGKVMFLHLSVNHSGGCLPRGGVYPGGVFAQLCVCPGGCLPRGVSAWECLPHCLGRHPSLADTHPQVCVCQGFTHK